MSVLHRGLHVVSKQLFYLLIILSVLSAMAMGSIYWLSNAIEQRQDEIAHWVSEKLDYPVTIGSANLQRLGVMPKLHIERFELLSKDRSTVILSLDSLYLGLDVISSIQMSEPVLNDISLKGLSIAIIKDDLGKIELKGFKSSTPSTDSGSNWLSWVNVLSHFELDTISVDYVDQSLPQLSGLYQLNNASVSHDDLDWSTTGMLVLPKSLGQNVQFNFRFQQQEDWQNSPWQGEIKTTHLVTSQLAQLLPGLDVSVVQGDANLTLAAEGKGKNVTSMMTSLALSQLELQSLQMSDPAAVKVDNLVADINWQQQGEEGDWILTGQKLAVTMNGEIWPETNFTVIKNIDDWLVKTNYLRLSDLSSLALLTPNSPEQIRQQKPAGDIESLSVNYSVSEGLKSVVFNLKEGAFLPWQDYPGVSGLTGSVDWHDTSAKIALNSHQLHFYAEEWLDKAVFFDSVTGEFKVDQDDSGWSLQSDAVRVWNDDLSLQLDGNIKHLKPNQTRTNLVLKLDNVNVKQWKNYVPQRVLDDDFQAWANTAFVDGKIVEGQIELLGDLAAFPYDKPETADGHFDMALQVENVQLHYAPDWPDLYNVTGTITGSGNDLIIDSQQGNVAGFDFVKARTVITKLVESAPLLQTDAVLTGTTKQALDFVSHSPLKKRFAEAIKMVKATGKSDITLDLNVPLADPDSTTAKGTVSFENSQLQSTSSKRLSLKKINGKLNFSGDGLMTDQDITATLLNAAVKVKVKPTEKDTAVSVKGNLSTQAINQLWPNSVPAFIDGKAAYEAKLSVREEQLGNFYVNYGLFTDMQGIEISTPAPFSKKRDEKLNVILSAELVDKEMQYSLNYGDVLNSKLAENNGEWRAAIGLGKVKPDLPKHGVLVRGRLDKVSIDDWLVWSEKLPESNNDSLLTMVDDVSMTIDSLTGLNHELTDVNYSLNKDAQGWRIKLHSNETQGLIYLPSDLNGPASLDINLDRLDITLPEKNAEVKQKMALWPAMKINIDSLRIDDLELGHLQLAASRTEHAWRVDSASLSTQFYTASVTSAEWLQTATTDETKGRLHLKSNDLGGSLMQLGYQKAIDAKNVEITADMHWTGTPLDVTRANVAGDMKFSLGQGKLNDVEPGAAGRIFGLMSIAALPRRLALDFSDLFSKKGFNFDSISSSFAIKNGKATTDDFILKGPSANIEISGPVDFVAQRYDQVVKVTPNVSSTLPLAGAVAGGPVGLGVGAAILLVDKLSDSLFGKNIVNLISYKYVLTGPWDSPDFKVLQSTTSP
jgi:uncharacterized protein (TIGR02099 family)